MPHNIFIGRKVELERLEALYKKQAPGLVVVKGRRRIGKSRLIFEFAKTKPNKPFWEFAGLAPQEGILAQDQRDNFARQLALKLKIAPPQFKDWTDAFECLSLYLKPGEIIVFDEISWMGSQDQTFISKLKVWWDKQRAHCLMFFCGSISTWVEENILKSTAFFGRINLTIDLEPLSIPESAQFFKKNNVQLSDYDFYKLLSITGGIPWYLEQIHPGFTADENIKQLAFSKNGLLVGEFERIFNDLFNGQGSGYKQILDSLKDGAKTLIELKAGVEPTYSKVATSMLENLILAGFVSKQPLWIFKTAISLKQSLYRISDPYIRFYLKMIAPNLPAILAGEFDQAPISTMPGFDAHIGLQLESLLLQNRPLLTAKIGVLPADILRSGPYRQTKNSSKRSCQVDYLIQTKTNTLFVCEFKFKKREINNEIIVQMQEKLARLKAPKGFAKVPVLFHLSGVTHAVVASNYFYRIIDIMDLLEEQRH